MNRVCAIIAAAGKGSRMGAGINKQFIHIEDKPILYYSLTAFASCDEIDDIIISAHKDEVDYIKENIVAKYKIEKVLNVVPGGKERQESVLNALMAAKGCDIVLIHDGARPFVTHDIIKDGITYAKEFGACACGVTPKDTIKKRSSEGFSQGTLNRAELYNVQTPQCFKYDLIMDCHQKAAKQCIKFTDDTAVVEAYGYKVYLYEGSYSNIKITTPEDLILAQSIIKYSALTAPYKMI